MMDNFKGENFFFIFDGNPPSQNHAIGHKVFKKGKKFINLSYPTKNLKEWKNNVMKELVSIKNINEFIRLIVLLKDNNNKGNYFRNIKFIFEMFIGDTWISKTSKEFKQKDLMNIEKYTSDSLFEAINAGIYGFLDGDGKINIKKNDYENKIKALKKERALIDDKNTLAVYSQKVLTKEKKIFIKLRVLDSRFSIEKINENFVIKYFNLSKIN